MIDYQRQLLWEFSPRQAVFTKKMWNAAFYADERLALEWRDGMAVGVSASAVRVMFEESV
ncbi:MAG: hypothetical protein HC871_12970 [Rhizobiales bacterium]|nr:hypothetical protein [Hyphomicrobiales bacterium]